MPPVTSNVSAMRFELWDDTDHRGGFAVRSGDQVRAEFHDMKVGEFRDINEGMAIVRTE